MVHLRIVVPGDLSKRVFELLDHTPSVCNLIYLEGAARRPQGDVILCDVAREDASIVISDLRELRVHERGSIALEDIDSQVSDAAVRAEKYAVGLPSDAVVWEEVESRTSEDVELSASFLAFMVLAVMIAAVGILTDQIILIIGAMVVGPEFGPIAALSVAAVERPPTSPSAPSSRLRSAFPPGSRQPSSAPRCSTRWDGSPATSLNRGIRSPTSSPDPTSSASSSPCSPASPGCSR